MAETYIHLKIDCVGDQCGDQCRYCAEYDCATVKRHLHWCDMFRTIIMERQRCRYCLEAGRNVEST